jgi:hypothetical protein
MKPDLKSVPANGAATEEMLVAGAKVMAQMLSSSDELDTLTPAAQVILVAAAVYKEMIAAAPDFH